MRLDEVRAQYQHVRLAWAHSVSLLELNGSVRELRLLQEQATAHFDDDLAANIEALSTKIEHRIEAETQARKPTPDH